MVLAVMGGVAGQAWMIECAANLKALWLRSALAKTAAKKAWMLACTVVMESLGTTGLDEVCAPAIVFCPLARWLKQWDPEKDYLAKAGYKPPNGDTIQQMSAIVNVWSRQWPPALVKQVVQWAEQFLEQRCMASPGYFAVPDPHSRERWLFRRSIPICTPILATFFPLRLVYSVMGEVCRLLDVYGDLDIFTVALAGRPANEACIIAFMALWRCGAGGPAPPSVSHILQMIPGNQGCDIELEVLGQVQSFISRLSKCIDCLALGEPGIPLSSGH